MSKREREKRRNRRERERERKRNRIERERRRNRRERERKRSRRERERRTRGLHPPDPPLTGAVVVRYWWRWIQAYEGETREKKGSSRNSWNLNRWDGVLPEGERKTIRSGRDKPSYTRQRPHRPQAPERDTGGEGQREPERLASKGKIDWPARLAKVTSERGPERLTKEVGQRD